MKLTKDRIVDAALALLDEVGLDGLSTRAIADRLGVTQPALYWHFKSRRALLVAMNDRMLTEHMRGRPPEPDEGWREFLTVNTHRFRAMLLSRRDGARIHAGTEAGPEDLEPSERQVELLVESGWTLAGAFDVLVALSRYTLGCVLEEQAALDEGEQAELDNSLAGFPMLSAAMDHYRTQGAEADFEAGLRLLLDGAACRLSGEARGASPPE